MADALIEHGERVVALDNLSTGIFDLVCNKAVLVLGSIADERFVRYFIQDYTVEEVIHFAGYPLVSESIADLRHCANNASESQNLIEMCVQKNEQRFDLSPTAQAIQALDGESISKLNNPYDCGHAKKILAEALLEHV